MNMEIMMWKIGWKNFKISSFKRTFVLICAHANRTRTIGNFLIEQGYKNTAHLFGGMALWQHKLRETKN